MLKVMTFNVRYGEAEDGANAWPHRRASVFDTIRSHDPDLVGLQEPDPRQCAEVAAALADGWTAIHGAGIDARTPEAHGKAIFYRRARFEESGRGVFWISETPDVPGSILQPNMWGERTVAWVRLRDLTTGRELVFCCTHFDTHPGCLLRSAELAARELAPVLAGTPAILVGDFNAPAGSPAWSHLTGPAGFRDAWCDAGTPEAGVVTFNGWTMVDRHPATREAATAYLRGKYGKGGNGPHHVEEYGRLRNERIDWILLKGALACSAAEADTTVRDGRYASDHFAVVARVDWKA